MKRPGDPAQLGKLIGDMAVGIVPIVFGVTH